MNWEQLLDSVVLAYEKGESQPISAQKYLALLAALASLLPLIKMSDALDTDIRRSLPGGGSGNLESVPSMHSRILDASTFAMQNSIYGRAGVELARCLKAVVKLVSQNTANMALFPYQSTLESISQGNL